MYRKITATAFLSFIFTSTFAQNVDNIISADNNSFGLFLFAMIVIVPLLFIIGKLYFDFKQQLKENNEWKNYRTCR